MSNKYQDLARTARKERIKNKMCSDKRAYQTLEEAQVPNQRTYRCPFCRLYHRSGQQERFIKSIEKKRNL